MLAPIEDLSTQAKLALAKCSKQDCSVSRNRPERFYTHRKNRVKSQVVRAETVKRQHLKASCLLHDAEDVGWRISPQWLPRHREPFANDRAHVLASSTHPLKLTIDMDRFIEANKCMVNFVRHVHRQENVVPGIAPSFLPGYPVAMTMPSLPHRLPTCWLCLHKLNPPPYRKGLQHMSPHLRSCKRTFTIGIVDRSFLLPRKGTALPHWSS